MPNIFKVGLTTNSVKQRIQELNSTGVPTTFELVKNFSYDYTFGFAYDDDDFLLKIKSKNINLVNLFNDEYFFGGIHLWHNFSYKSGNIESNEKIFEKKKDYYSKTGIYIDIIILK